MNDYYGYIQDGMQPIVKAIINENFSQMSRKWSPLSTSAAVHFYVHYKLDYISRHEGGTRPFRVPTETWEKGGNCEEKSVFLTSLYNSIKGINTRLVSVTNFNGDAHLLVELGVDGEIEMIEDELDSFYDKLEINAVFPKNNTYLIDKSKSDNINWYLADPEMSSFVGDGKNLKNQTFITHIRRNKEFYEFEWEQLNYYVYPNKGVVKV